MLEHAAVGEAGDRELELERQLHDQVHKANSDTRNEENQTLARIEHRLEAIKKVARSADNLMYEPRVKTKLHNPSEHDISTWTNQVIG